MVSYVLGEPFPIKQYAVPGDHVWPILTEQSFDVVQSLTDISPNELHAYGYEPINVALFRYNQVPFIVFDFGGTVLGEVAINIHKIDKRRLDYWLDSDDNTVTIYLLEGRDTCLRNIRYIELPMMARVKEILRSQLKFDFADIENQITNGRNMYPVGAMVALAEDRCTISKPEICL